MKQYIILSYSQDHGTKYIFISDMFKNDRLCESPYNSTKYDSKEQATTMIADILCGDFILPYYQLYVKDSTMLIVEI